MRAGLEVLLVEGLTDDFVELRVLAGCIADSLRINNFMRASDRAVEELVRQETIEVVKEALAGGLATVVTFDEISGVLSPWETSTEQSVAIIESEWRRLGRPLSLYEVACLSLTDAGRTWGRALNDAPKLAHD